jgi:probable O-glycosylation ligase (exosortase A-associated)
MLCITLALGFFGIKNAIWFLLGQQTGVGPGGMLKDNNDFALAMVMNLPLLWYLSDEARDEFRMGRVMRIGMRVAFVMTMMTVMATGSRGGFLAMGATLFFMSMKTRYKVPTLMGMALLGGLGLLLAPAEYIDRLSTITEAKDASVVGRLVSWKVAGNMIKGNPIMGIGFKNMVWDYQSYVAGIELPPGITEIPSRVAHNSYLQVWAESGTITFAVFMFILGSTILLARRLTKRTAGTIDAWVGRYGRAIEVSFLGFMVGATFLNRAHFDLIYQLVGVAAAIPSVVLVEHQRLLKLGRRPGPAPARSVRIGAGRAPTRPVG